jgi:uncharacterized protein HemY
VALAAQAWMEATRSASRSAGAICRRRRSAPIDCDDPDQAARIIRDALGIECDDVVNYCFPTTWPDDRERRTRYIGEWLKTEARYLAS